MNNRESAPSQPSASTITIAGIKLTAQQLLPLLLTKDNEPPVTYLVLAALLKKLCKAKQPLQLSVAQWSDIVAFVLDSPVYRQCLTSYRVRHPFPILDGLQGLLGMVHPPGIPQDTAIELNPRPLAGFSYLCDLSEGYFQAAINDGSTAVVNGRFLAKASPQGGEYGETVLLALEACCDVNDRVVIPGFLYTPIDNGAIRQIKRAISDKSPTVQLSRLDLAFARPLDRSEDFTDDPRALLTKAQQVRTGIWRQSAHSATERVLNGAKK